MDQLRISDRRGMASLWIGNLNIWDLPHNQVTQDVLDAIRSAYKRGRYMAMQEVKLHISRIDQERPADYKWVDERKNA